MLFTLPAERLFAAESGDTPWVTIRRNADSFAFTKRIATGGRTGRWLHLVVRRIWDAEDAGLSLEICLLDVRRWLPRGVPL